MAEPVIFQGEFNLEQALAQFAAFATKIEARLGILSKTFTTSFSGGASGNQRTFADVITDKHSKLAASLNDFAAQSEKANARLTKSQLDTEKTVTDSQDRIGNGFINIAIRSYALHQVGNFLDRTVTQPLKELAQEVLSTTLRFDTLEQLLTKRGTRSLEEVGKSFDTIGRVAKLRNLDLETSVNLYSKLFEATRGALDDQLFEKIGRGLSNVLTTIESSEKRAFFGQLQDILGGGNVANLQRTLSLAPALKSVFDEIKRANESLSDKDAIIQAFARLGNLPVLGDLATKIKNIRVELELLAYKLGQIYKNEIVAIVDFIDAKVLPTLDSLIKQFERAPAFIQNIIAVIAGLTAALAPILSTLGTIILLFPNSALATGFFTTIIEAVSTLPALLNPIVAVIVGLVAILTKAFTENAGGFGDALTTMVSTVLPALVGILKTVYDTIKAIVDIVVNIYTLIDAVIPLTATLGVIGSILAYIISFLAQVLNFLSIIPATLQLIADILGGDVNKAFDKFYLQWLKIAEPINKVIESITGLAFSHQKEIDQLEKDVNGYNKASLSGAEQADRAQKELLQRYKEVEVSVKAITDAIKQQNKEIDAQIAKNRQAAIERQNQGQNYIDKTRSDFYATAVGDADLSTAAGRAQAEGAFQTQLTSERLSAETQRNQRIQAAIRAYLQKQRDAIVETLRTETKDNGDKLDEQAKQIYQQYAVLLEAAITQKQDITQEGADSLIFNLLRKRLTTLKVSDNELRVLASYLAGEKVLFQNVLQGQLENRSELDNFQRAADAKTKQFYENQRKAAEEEEKLRKSSPIQVQISQIQSDIQRISDYKSQLLALKDEYIDLDKFVGALTDLDNQLIKKYDEKADAEKQLAFIQYKSGAEYDAAIDKINQQTKELKEKLQDTSNRDQQEVFKGIIKDQLQQADQLRELIENLQSNVGRFVDTSIATGNISKDKIANINTNYDFIFQLLTEQNLKKLQQLTGLAAPILGAIPGKIAEPLRDAFKAIGSISDTDLANPETRKKLIDQSVDVVKILNNYINTANQLSPQGRAQIELFINQYTKFIETLNDGQSILSQKINLDVLKLQVKEVDLERQQNIVDLTRDELDITRQILELRQQRGIIPDIKGLGSFGKALIDIFTNGAKAQYEIQQAILQQEIQAAQIETDLAIIRLQIEEQILLLKLKEAGASEEDIKKVRDEYEKEIDLIKEKGALQKIQIQEELKSLKEFSGSIGDIFGQIFGKIISKITGNKSSQGTVTAVDDNGNNVPIKDDDKIDQPVVTDDSVDATKKNVDATNGWLDSLKGGLKTTKDAIFALGDAIAQTNDFSIKGILRTIKEELKALGAKMAVKALEFAALALAAAVFGDYQTAGKAAAAAASYAVAAGAAYAAAGLIGTVDGNGAANSQSAASRSAGTTNAGNPTQDKAILKQQALSVLINLDIRTDDGIIIKKNIKALNQNTELTNLTLNSQEGWAFAPTV